MSSFLDLWNYFPTEVSCWSTNETSPIDLALNKEVLFFISEALYAVSFNYYSLSTAGYGCAS